jgi:Crinkler effector protein N-terminal domain
LLNFIPLDTHPRLSTEPTLNHCTLELNCLVLGDDPTHTFQVEIEETKTVAALKDAIKNKNKPAFDCLTAHSLVLWKVSIAVDDSLNENLHDLDLGGEKPLPPLDELSEVFSDSLARKHLHILVQPPLTSEWE